jgi:predicted ester cyclase
MGVGEMNSGAFAASPRVAVWGRPPRPPASLHPGGFKSRAPAGGLRRQCAPTRVKAHAINQQVRSFVATPTFIHIAPRRNQMSTAQETSNKATVRRFDDVVSTGDAEVISKTIDELVEPDVLIHMPLPIQATGAQALKQVWAMLLRGLPDLHVAVEDVIAEGDKVVSRNTVTGTHQGEYRGLPPTGKSVTTRSI